LNITNRLRKFTASSNAVGFLLTERNKSLF
jgi:hypothetical protein